MSLNSSERAQILASRHKIQVEIDELWSDLDAAIERLPESQFSSSEADMIFRLIEDGQEAINALDRMLARG